MQYQDVQVGEELRVKLVGLYLLVNPNVEHITFDLPLLPGITGVSTWSPLWQISTEQIQAQPGVSKRTLFDTVYHHLYNRNSS
jgi:hypothetical protein